MKNLLIALVAVCLAACAGAPKATVTVNNPANFQQTSQTVEVAWDTLVAKVAELTPENVVVTDLQGTQVPSQVIFEGGETPRSLIFQVTLAGGESADFSVMVGTRKAYKAETFGRFVPERLDDYAWENNVVAYRIYGPALEKDMVTNGIDFWSKSTPELVIDAWYEKDLSGKGSYHLDTGEGNDCYNVGTTLGMGASSPVWDGKLCYSRNFASWKTLDNGPVRTSVQLTYAPFAVGDLQVSLVKTISLDANTRFNKIVDLYSGDFDTISVAAGVIMHDSTEVKTGADWSALYEPASDSRSGKDGYIGGAVVLPGSSPLEIDHSMTRVVTVKAGQPMVYYAGAGTSKRDMTDAAKWFDYVGQTAASLAAPLQVTVK